jgi:nucleoside-diphosphate-sugar epimerase
VIHGASAARPVLHGTDPVATIKANLLGSFHLLDLSVAKRSRGFALMSSAEVYGAQPTGAELIEEQSYGGFDILAPRACYAEGKRAAETICAAYQAQFGIECRVARFGHVYGPGMALDDGRVQADFAANVVAGQHIVLTSDGSAVRTYTYVADAIAGLFYTLLRGDQMAYNIADPGGLVSIRRLAELFTQVRPEKSLRLVFTNESDARSYSPVKRQGLSSERLAALGWRPLVGLAAGLDRMVTELESVPQATVT